MLRRGLARNLLAKDSVRAEIPAFETVGEKTAHKLQKREIYKIMCRFTGYHSPWGCMTGVRPAKIVNSLLRSGMTPDEAVRELKAFYLASPEKAELAVETACNRALPAAAAAASGERCGLRWNSVLPHALPVLLLPVSSDW